MDHALDLSVVVPVYNAYPYIVECVESILGQDLLPERYEAIFVDDGSTDEGAAYLDAVCAEHANLRVIHQPNSGTPALPRNAGIEAARGDYIFFCDADDTFYPGVFVDMIEHARATGCDIGLFKVDGTDHKRTYAGLFDETREHCTFDNAPLISFMAPYKLFKRSLLIDNGIRFLPKIGGEDVPFSLECFFQARNICTFGDRYYYRYRLRSDGTSCTMGGLSDGFDNWDAKCAGAEALLAVADAHTMPARHPGIYLLAYKRIVGYLQGIFDAPGGTDHVLRVRYQNGLDGEADVVPRIPDDPGAEQHLERLRALVAAGYCDEVRSAAPFTLMVAIDAVVRARELDDLRSGIWMRTIDATPHFFTVDGAWWYSLRLADGHEAVRAPLPPQEMMGERLLMPRLRKAMIDALRVRDGAMLLEGRVFALLSADTPIDGLAVRLKCAQTGAALDVAARPGERTTEQAYAGLRTSAATWRAEVALAEIARTFAPEDGRARVDLHLAYLSGGETVCENRLGYFLGEGVEEAFVQQCATDEAPHLLPHVTGLKNLSFDVSARWGGFVGVCRITSLAWDGDLLRIEGETADSHALAPQLALFLENYTDEARLRTAEVALAPADGAAAREGYLLWSACIDPRALLGGGDMPAGMWRMMVAIRVRGEETCLPFGRKRPKGTLAEYRGHAVEVVGATVTSTKVCDDGLGFEKKALEEKPAARPDAGGGTKGSAAKRGAAQKPASFASRLKRRLGKR